METKKTKATGWKCFDQELKCRGMQFEIGKTVTISGELKMCKNGLHFHEQPEHVFNYYDKDSRVCEIEASKVITSDDKSVCSSLKVIREIKGIEKKLLGSGSGSGDGSGDGDGSGSGYGDGYGIIFSRSFRKITA